MSNSAKSKLYAFERALFLKSRSMKTAGALAAVGALSSILDDLGAEDLVKTNSIAGAVHAKLDADIAGVTAALQAGANDVALQLYGSLINAIPTVHALAVQALPIEARGSGPTKPEALIDAAQRAMAILNF